MPANGNQPIAIIQIVMHATPEGVPAINATFQGPDRNVFNMMMQRDIQDVVPMLIEKERNKSVVMPTPEATLALGR